MTRPCMRNARGKAPLKVSWFNHVCRPLHCSTTALVFLPLRRSIHYLPSERVEESASLTRSACSLLSAHRTVLIASTCGVTPAYRFIGSPVSR